MKQLALICCSFCFVAYSQDCNISLSGYVTDFHDGSKFENVTLYIEELNIFTYTDKNGFYIFNKLCEGNYAITVSHLSCDTKTLNLSIKNDKTLDVTLEHHVEELQEVTVTGDIIKQTKTSQETAIKSDVIEIFSSASLGDALKQVSGVSSINTGNSIVKPVINGLHSSRILIISNGVRLQDQEWGIEHAPNIDINASENISVIKGADALAFGGDAVGGTIVLNPSRTISKDSLYGKVITSGQTNGRGFSTNASLTKTFENGWYGTVQGTYKRYGDFESPDYILTNTGLNSIAFSVNTGFKTFEKGFNVFYSFTDNEIGILRASHIGNVEDLVNSINSQQPLVINDFSYDINSPRQDVRHHLFKAELYKRFKNFGKVNVKYDFQNNQRYEFDVRVGDDRNKAAVDLTLKTHSLNIDTKVDSDDEYTIQFGVVGRYQNNFANPETGVRRIIPDYDKYDVGLYSILTFDANDKLLLNIGARYDFNRFEAKKFYLKSRWEERGYDIDFSDIIIDEEPSDWLTNPKFNYHNFSASAGLAYDLGDDQELLFSYSLSSRAPNASELFSDGLHHSAARIELGDLRIKKEGSNRFSASYSLKTNKISILVEPYVNFISDFIYIEPFGTEQTIRGAFPIWEYKQNDASIFGTDLTLEYDFIDHWNLNNKTSFIRGRDTENVRPLIDMPPFKTLSGLTFSKKKWNNLNLSLTSEFSGRQNQFPDNNFETFIPTTNETVLVDISTPPSAYHLMHFRGSMDFRLKADLKLNIALDVNNIFDTSYRDYLNRLRFFADDLGRNIKLQLKINF